MKRSYHETEGAMKAGPFSSPSYSNQIIPKDPSDSGDGGMSKMPKISRKVNACTECRTRKIRCDLSNGATVCVRCRKKGLKCVVNKSLQSLLEGDSEWKIATDQNARQLQLAVSKILETLKLPALHTFSQTGANVRFDISESRSPEFESSATAMKERGSMAMTRENSQDAESSNELANEGLVAPPMGTLFEVTKLRNLRSNPRGQIGTPKPTLLEDDFISQNKVSLMEAQGLFDVFSRSLNHYLWGGIALVHSDLASVRASSSLLLAAILTVTALHIPGKENIFDICYGEFIDLVCDSMMDRYHTLDGVRGLCIGAFWLSDVSWKLSGHAVRIATELNLHQSYAKAMKGSAEHVQGARLWYFLYVCDHHFSIAYGRPPVIQNDSTIMGHEEFLRLPGITEADHRLHSQIAVFIILSEMYNAFGPDTEQILSDEQLIRLQNFNVGLDNWRVNWERRLGPNIYISTYPAKGVALHYFFAKLQLNSLALRGFQHTARHELSPDRQVYADMAISAAMTVLRTVLDEPSIRNSIVGVPLYLHTMITGSSVFLLKIQTKWKPAILGSDSAIVQDLVRQIIKLVSEAKASERHLTYHIASGLQKMLDRFVARENRELARKNKGLSDGNNTAAVANMGYELTSDYDQFGIFQSPELFDGNYFPVGFFDVI